MWYTWPYIWSADHKIMAHYRLWIQWFIRGKHMNEEVKPEVKPVPEVKKEDPNKKATQDESDRGDNALPLPM